MCIGCFNHLLADARMRDETATCPNCRTEISKNLSSRNLAVEKAVSELPAQCQFCGHEYSRNTLEKHENEFCEERYLLCQSNSILVLLIDLLLNSSGQHCANSIVLAASGVVPFMKFW